jgi:hypothetical protein
MPGISLPDWSIPEYFLPDGRVREKHLERDEEILAATNETLSICRNQVLSPDSKNPEKVLGFLKGIRYFRRLSQLNTSDGVISSIYMDIATAKQIRGT